MPPRPDCCQRCAKGRVNTQPYSPEGSDGECEGQPAAVSCGPGVGERRADRSVTGDEQECERYVHSGGCKIERDEGANAPVCRRAETRSGP
jgi:hypothetical protein